MKLTDEMDPIREWAHEKGLFANGDIKTQMVKLIEECGELSMAILKDDLNEFDDAIGDCVIVLTNMAAMKGSKIEDCINNAFRVIAKRSGSMKNGTFVKNQ